MAQRPQQPCDGAERRELYALVLDVRVLESARIDFPIGNICGDVLQCNVYLALLAT